MAAVCDLSHELHLLPLGVFAVDLPVTLVNGDHQGFGALLDLVAISGECTGVEVVNLSNRSESDELDDDIDDIMKKTEKTIQEYFQQQ